MKNDDEVIYDWIFAHSPHKTIDKEKTRSKILKKYRTLPAQVSKSQWEESENDDSFRYSLSFFIDIYENSEFSKNWKYIFFHLGQGAFERISWYTSIIFLVSIVGINLLRGLGLSEKALYSFTVFIWTNLGVSLVSRILSVKFLNILLFNLKPGDMIRVLLDTDTRVIYQPALDFRKKSIFDSPYTFESKKIFLCREILGRYQSGEYRTLNELFIAFLALDFLVSVCESDLSLEYYAETAITILSGIAAFKPDSPMLDYYRGLYHLMLKKYRMAKKYFESYLEKFPSDVESLGYLYFSRYKLRGNNLRHPDH